MRGFQKFCIGLAVVSTVTLCSAVGEYSRNRYILGELLSLRYCPLAISFESHGMCVSDHEPIGVFPMIDAVPDMTLAVQTSMEWAIFFIARSLVVLLMSMACAIVIGELERERILARRAHNLYQPLLA